MLTDLDSDIVCMAEAPSRYNYVLAHVRGAHACSKTAISKRGKKVKQKPTLTPRQWLFCLLKDSVLLISDIFFFFFLLLFWFDSPLCRARSGLSVTGWRRILSPISGICWPNWPVR